MSADYAAIAGAGLAALKRGDAQAARTAFETVEAAGRGTHRMRLLLAQACMLSGDGPAADRLLAMILASEPANLYAMVMRGDILAKSGDLRAAVSWYEAALRQAPRAGRLPADLIQILGRVEKVVAGTGTAFEAHIHRQMADHGIAAPGGRFSEAIEILTGRATVMLQQPTSFYYPGLAQRAWFEREEFSWVPALEAQAPAIRAELEALLAGDEPLPPYVAAETDRPAKPHPLLDDPRWSAFHLYRDGVPVPENVRRFPATMAALRDAPIPQIAGRSPMVLFSVLRAGTHIPPHHGMLNTRLICHLPLIVPEGCRLRVGNHERAVVRDRVMLFDDTIEHEAWNDSEAVRVVLLFEIWRPELDETERAALTALYQAIGSYSSLAGG